MDILQNILPFLIGIPGLTAFIIVYIYFLPYLETDQHDE